MGRHNDSVGCDNSIPFHKEAAAFILAGGISKHGMMRIWCLITPSVSVIKYLNDIMR